MFSFEGAPLRVMLLVVAVLAVVGLGTVIRWFLSAKLPGRLGIIAAGLVVVGVALFLPNGSTALNLQAAAPIVVPSSSSSSLPSPMITASVQPTTAPPATPSPAATATILRKTTASGEAGPDSSDSGGIVTRVINPDRAFLVIKACRAEYKGDGGGDQHPIFEVTLTVNNHIKHALLGFDAGFDARDTDHMLIGWVSKSIPVDRRVEAGESRPFEDTVTIPLKAETSNGIREVQCKIAQARFTSNVTWSAP